MSEDRVSNIPGRGSIDDPVFQRALRLWRAWAHRRGLVVGSPVRLIGAEKTIYGDSDNMTEGARSYVLTDVPGVGVAVGDLWLSDKDQELLAGIVSDLDDRAEIDIRDIRAPSEAELEEFEEEKGRWDLVIDRRRIGIVVRVGEGSSKHYLLHLWIAGGWRLVRGAPCFDLPMFGLPGLRKAGDDMPVMIHEGPKAWESADNRMDGWVHVAWHGSEWGMEWTDWSPLRGRRCLIWPDCDEAGIRNARLLASRLALMGGVIEYVNWSIDDIRRWGGWDWADDGGFSEISAGEIQARTVLVESPVGPDGSLSEAWAQRSFFDLEKREVYMVSRNFRPLPLDALAMDKPKTFRNKVVSSTINPFVGLDYRPGLPMGRLADGRINVCPPSPRDVVVPRPFPRGTYKEIAGTWLRRMIPDLRERKHVIRRAAWAVARPGAVPQHMIVLQGESGVGKSVLLDLIVALSGRGVSILPDSIFSRFNAQIGFKSVVAIHEIHSNDMTRKQNAGRLKELIANSVIEIEEKNRPKVLMSNVIHWFAATNEKVPFSLEHGNDRFYFVRCESPSGVVARARMKRFFRKWVPIFRQEGFLDELAAGAKYLVEGFKKKVEHLMVERAERQDVWSVFETASLRPWEQLLKDKLEEVCEPDEEAQVKHPPVFSGDNIVNLICDRYSQIGQDDVRRRMVEFGYCTLRSENGHNYRRRSGKRGPRFTIWCRQSDLATLQQRGDYGSLELSELRVSGG